MDKGQLTMDNSPSNDVPPGYKRTEVGVIPEDWHVVGIGDLNPFVTSGSRGWARFYPDTGAPFIRITNLSRQSIYLDLSDLKFVVFPPQASVEASRTELQDGDLLISITADIGIIGFVDSSTPKPAYMNQHIAMIRFDQSLVYSRFAAYSLASERPQRLFIASMDIGAKAGMSLLTVRKIRLALPPLPEQRAIAALDQLIAKKRAIKQAAMQQLLTGKTRLPGFSGEWEEVKLGDLFSFKNGLNKAKKFFGYGTPIVNYMDVFGRSGIYASNLEGRVSLTKQEIRNFDVQKGDVFFTRTSETPEEIGIAAVMLDEATETVFSGFVLRARPKDKRLCDEFKAYCFSSAFVRMQIISKASYTTRALTNGRILSEVLLPLPPPDEQTAIAAVLSDMDTELAALARRRDKTKQIKQGMMQQLLTGRIRLV